MFGIDSAEFLIIALVALVVIGPKDLPKVMRAVGSFVARARGMARHFRSGIDAMMREAELKEMNEKWREHNERIMRDCPTLPSDGTDWGKAPADPPSAKSVDNGPRRSSPMISTTGPAAPPIPPAGVTPPPDDRP